MRTDNLNEKEVIKIEEDYCRDCGNFTWSDELYGGTCADCIFKDNDYDIPDRYCLDDCMFCNNN